MGDGMKLLAARSVTTPEINAVHCMDALALLRALPNNSVDAVITDPPYPEIDRDYGRLSEETWHELMQNCVLEFKRVLKPTGSAAIILQPNSQHIGQMRLWLWEFIVWAGKEWNVVQDAYWWNHAAMPTTGVAHGLLRPSVKYVVWLGNPDCYRNQLEVLWTPSQSTMAMNAEDRALQHFPSGMTKRAGRIKQTVLERGGSTPFNLLPVANTNSTKSAGSEGHGAGTPMPLADWWVRYLCPPGGVVLDVFAGSGTIPLAARNSGRGFYASEQSNKFSESATALLAEPYNLPMFGTL